MESQAFSKSLNRSFSHAILSFFFVGLFVVFSPPNPTNVIVVYRPHLPAMLAREARLPLPVHPIVYKKSKFVIKNANCLYSFFHFH